MKRGYFYSVLSAILFGTAGILVKLAYRTGLDSVDLLTVQYIFAVPLMFVMGFLTNRKNLHVTKKQLKNLIVLGTIGNTLMTVFYYKAFEYLPVAMVTMLLFTYPIMVFLYSCFSKKEKMSSKKAAAVFLAFIGCILTLNILSGGFHYSVIGIMFGLLSAVFYAFMNIYSEEKLSLVDSLSINAYSTLFSLAALIVYRPPINVLNGHISLKSFGLVVVIAVFNEIIPLTLLYASIKYIGSLKVSVISNLELPTATFFSFIILKEPVSVLQILGLILIIYSAKMVRDFK